MNNPNPSVQQHAALPQPQPQPPVQNAPLVTEDWSVRQPRSRRRVVPRLPAPQRFMEVHDVAGSSRNLNPSGPKSQETVDADIKGTKRKQPENPTMKGLDTEVPSCEAPKVDVPSDPKGEEIGKSEDQIEESPSKPTKGSLDLEVKSHSPSPSKPIPATVEVGAGLGGNDKFVLPNLNLPYGEGTSP